jgi:hypothetical protein
MTASKLDMLSEITSLKTRLLPLPGALAAARLDLQHAKAQTEELRNARRDLEVEHALFVHGETTPDGKTRFSNDTARKAETQRRLTSDSRVRDLSKRLADAEAEVGRATVEVERLEDEHRTCAIVKDLLVAEAQLFLGLSRLRGASHE